MTSAVELDRKLIPLEEFKTSVLDSTEGVTTRTPNDMSFDFPDLWNAGLDQMPGDQVTEAKVSFDGEEFNLTKDAALSLTSSVGLQRKYVGKTPGRLIEAHMNYWVDQDAFDMNFLTRRDVMLAGVKSSITPFSNFEILNRIVRVITSRYDLVKVSDLLVDYKYTHDLRETAFRLVVPGVGRVIDSPVPEDFWNMGVEVKNSVIGDIPLSIRGYLFRWVCTNGMTKVDSSTGQYNRKKMGQTEAVYDWVEATAHNVLDELPHELETIQTLTGVNLEGDVSETMHSIFKSYGVPVKARVPIIDNLIDSEDMTAYGVLNAFTRAANDVDLPAAQVSKVLNIAGDLPHVLTDRCTACNRIK